jgi:hypothetical protein
MKYLVILVSLITIQRLSAQNILLVNDNDFIFENTDSIIDALDLSDYDNYVLWSIPDSAGEYPTSTYLANFDLVIWYCSTDGTGLLLWDGATVGNGDLVTHILDGYAVWVVGSDILYEQYGVAPDAFNVGDFTYDYLGISNYNVQSYGDDGNLGVPQLDSMIGVPSYFPDSIAWTFSTYWWVDGVTGRPGTFPMYAMGPSTYALADEVSMLHNTLGGVNVMTSLFDPALMNNQMNRIEFLEAGITYLLPADLSTGLANSDLFQIFPNPTTGMVTLKNIPADSEQITVTDIQGKIVYHVLTANLNNVSLDLSNLQNGIYQISLFKTNGIVSQQKIVVL